jgi:dihydrodipicolinate synthase/N-acetylneuraminate lyase
MRRVVQEQPLPLVLYNMPALTKMKFELLTLQTLAPIDRIIGIKDSSGDIAYFAQLMSLRALRPEWSILVGPEKLLPAALQLGADGGVCGGANLFPTLFSEYHCAAVAGNKARTEELSLLITELQALYEIGQEPSRFIKATKCALSLMGICNDLPAEPFQRFTPVERKKLQSVLEKIQPRIESVERTNG